MIKILARIDLKVDTQMYMYTLVNVYVDLVAFTRIAGAS